MIFGNLFQQLYNITDSVIVGRFVGENALAAVGASYAITNVFIAIAIGGLCMMVPEPISDVVGLVIVAGLYIYLRMTSKKTAVAA